MAYRYQGNSNVELIRALEEDELFSSAQIKRALLNLPRGDFLPPQYLPEAYMDRPLHLAEYNFNVSAPHMYAFCLNHLNLQPGHTFLDVGSGCGLMTALGAYLTAPNGKSVGVDISEKAICLARENLSKYLARNRVTLGSIQFEHRNIFSPDIQGRKWDRIHVGAAVTHKKKYLLYDLLNPGGILIVPIANHLTMAKKNMYGFTEETKLLEVRYGSLVSLSKKDKESMRKMQEMQLQLQSSSFISDIHSLFNNKFLSDVTFYVSGRPIYGHKAILVSRCVYFTSLYRSGMKESNDTTIHVEQYSYSAFFEFLRFLYTDKCDIPNTKIADELMSISEYYRVERLKSFAEISLVQLLSVENACSVLAVANKFGSKQLLNYTVDFIIQNYPDVKHTNTFSDMGKDVLTEILNTAVRRLGASNLG